MKINTLTEKAGKLIMTLVIAAGISACDGIGSLASNAKVTDADNDQVVFIGDSIFALSGELQDFLEGYAGETFRRYTISGAEITGGIYATDIATQFENAKRDNPNIDTVVMDGAGNDILIPATLFDPYGCRTHWWRWNISRSCVNLIEDQYVSAVNLMNQMNGDGVQDIVWLGYYELPRSNANLTQALNYGDAYLAYACEVSTTADCAFVDPRGTIPASQVESDDIHPTPAGSVNLANQIWPVLQPLL